MRPVCVVILTPVFDLFLRIVQADEYMLVETFDPKFAIEAFDVGVLCRLPWLNEVQLDAIRVRPGIEGFADELRAIVPSETNVFYCSHCR